MPMTLDFSQPDEGAEFAVGRDPAYLANLFLRLVRDLRACEPPPREIPADLLEAFSMGGRVPVRFLYRDDTILRVITERDAGERKILALPIYRKAHVEALIGHVRNRRTFQYGATDTWLYAALEQFPIAGLEVAVLGSAAPVYEAITLAHGGRPLTVEYQPRISDHPALTFLSPEQFARGPVMVDAALSISSFEHDGLGRYGDPIDPGGDLKAMRTLIRSLRPGGRLYLSVPIHTDQLYWNVNRIYGTLRLPLLLQGWRCLAVFGPPPGAIASLDPFRIDEARWSDWFEQNPNAYPEWVFVLEPDTR